MAMRAIDFSAPASEAQLEALADKLKAANFEVVTVDEASQARNEVLQRIPKGASIHSGKSKTLEDAGIFAELMQNEKYDFIRKRTSKMDRRTQGDDIRRAWAAPDVMLSSANAVTVSGQIVVTSASGSQIGPIASGAGHLILVIGSQKLVPDLESAFERIRQHVLPYEDARLREQMGVGTKITRTLILEQDFVPGRTTIVLVRQPIGV